MNKFEIKNFKPTREILIKEESKRIYDLLIKKREEYIKELEECRREIIMKKPELYI